MLNGFKFLRNYYSFLILLFVPYLSLAITIKQGADPAKIADDNDFMLLLNDTIKAIKIVQRSTETNSIYNNLTTCTPITPTPTITSSEQEKSIITVAIFYSEGLVDSDDKQQRMLARLKQVIYSSNLVFDNSKIAIELTLVHHQPVRYPGSGSLLTDIIATIIPGSGVMDEIYKIRDDCKADIAAWVTETDDSVYAGIVSSINPLVDFPLPPFAVIAGSSFLQDDSQSEYVFIHEIGHLLGASHDLATGFGFPKPGVHLPHYNTLHSLPFTARYYAHGYFLAVQNKSNKNKYVKTIMSYNVQDYCGDTGCETIPYFSNPSVNYLGTPTGTQPTNDTDLSSNNAKVLNENRLRVAKFR